MLSVPGSLCAGCRFGRFLGWGFSEVSEGHVHVALRFFLFAGEAGFSDRLLHSLLSVIFSAGFLSAEQGITCLGDMDVFVLALGHAVVCGHDGSLMRTYDLGVQEFTACLSLSGRFVRFSLDTQLRGYCLRLTGGDVVLIAQGLDFCGSPVPVPRQLFVGWHVA